MISGFVSRQPAACSAEGDAGPARRLASAGGCRRLLRRGQSGLSHTWRSCQNSQRLVAGFVCSRRWPGVRCRIRLA